MQIGKLLNKSRWTVGFYFAALLLVGICVYADYGVSWDEPTSRTNGLVSAKYTVSRFAPTQLGRHTNISNIPDLENYNDRDYGVAFELVLIALEKIALPSTAPMSAVYKLRHLATFLLFYTGVVFLYLTLRRRFNSYIWGLVGCTLLVTSPRIFAEGFYNDKDIALLAAVLIAVYWLIRFLESRSIMSAFLFGLATAFAIDIRILGVFLTCVGVGFAFWDLPWTKQWKAAAKLLAVTILYALTTALATYALWPYLWHAPLPRFVQSFENMSKFRWIWSVLYRGRSVPVTELPWHYIPVWIAITTPPSYLLLFLLGFGLIVYQAVRAFPRFYTSNKERSDLVIIVLAVAPVAGIILLHSVLYDGWRQMYFVYGPFTVVATIGMHRCWQWWKSKDDARLLRWISGLMLLATFANSTHAVWFMVKYHPHENVYFNRLAGARPHERFEADYWGLSYREGLEYVLSHDARRFIKVRVNNPPGYTNSFILSPGQQKRLQYVERDEDYYLTEHRNFNADTLYNEGELVHRIMAGNTRLLTVYSKHKAVDLERAAAP